MARSTLRTDRLVLRPMSTHDLPLLHELDEDAAVLRFILGRARTPEEVDAFWIPMIEAHADDELGMWVGSHEGVDVGWWSLWPRGASEAEAGWRLLPRHHGRGLAREGAGRLLDHGFARLGLTRVFAEAMAANRASRRVMEAIGMTHVRTEVRTREDPLPGWQLGEAVHEIRAADRSPRTGA